MALLRSRLTPKSAPLSRRRFLGAAVAIPAVATVVACGADPAINPGGGLPPLGPSGDAGTLDDAGIGADAGFDAGYTGDAGVEDAGSVIEQHLCDSSFPRIDLKKDCGAAGDGVTNDTNALITAAGMLQSAGGGELVIPPGVYIVGGQNPKMDPNAPGAFYAPVEMFKVSNLACVKVSGYGATLKLMDGLRYGGFNPSTGQPQDYTGGQINAAHVGHMLEFSSCALVMVEGLELDGSNESMILGGQWGDLDRQTSATGIWANMCEDVTIVDVHSHHHGLDGITVLHLSGPPSKKKPHRLLRVTSEYNGRQAISWIGGWGLECTDCKFNHTGRAMNGGVPLMSAPRAGLDIEPNANTTQISREGLFTRCEFIDNAGAGIVAAAGDGGYSTFVDCTVWGTTNYSLYITKPGLKFSNCRVYGTAVHASDGSTPNNPAPNTALATLFEDCLFEDKPWTDGRVFRNSNLYNLSEGGEGVTWRRCTFINHEVRGAYIGDPNTAELFDSCRFVHANSQLASGAYQSYFQGSKLRSCHFEETGLSATYFISVTNVTVLTPSTGNPPTHVDGPKVKWNSGSSTGTTGDIAPGNYA